MAFPYDNPAYTPIFGSIQISSQAWSAINSSALGRSLLADYRLAVGNGSMTSVTTQPQSGIPAGALGAFYDSPAPGTPGYLYLSPVVLGQSSAQQAYIVIHELIHFKFRASNAAMMAAVNNGDVDGFVAAYQRREAEAEAGTDQAVWEMREAGFQFPAGTRGNGELINKANRHQAVRDEALTANPNATEADIESLAIKKTKDRLDADGTRLAEACDAAFSRLDAENKKTINQGDTVCRKITLTSKELGDSSPPSFGLDVDLSNGEPMTFAVSVNGSATTVGVFVSGNLTSSSVTTPLAGTNLTSTATTSLVGGGGTDYTVKKPNGDVVAVSDTAPVVNNNGTITTTNEGSTVLTNSSTGKPILNTTNFVNTTPAGVTVSSGTAVANPVDGSQTQLLTVVTTSTTPAVQYRISTNADGEITGMTNLNETAQAVSAFNDAYALINAIKSGRALPIVSRPRQIRFAEQNADESANKQVWSLAA